MRLYLILILSLKNVYVKITQENSWLSQISNEIQAWTQIFEHKNNDRLWKMRGEMDNKLEAILRETKTNKNASTVTNPRSDVNEIQDPQPSWSKIDKSIGARASNNENSDSENDDYPPWISKKKLKISCETIFPKWIRRRCNNTFKCRIRWRGLSHGDRSQPTTP